MLKKLSLVLSVLAALGFAVAISAPADAKPQQQGNKNVQFKQSNKNVNFKQNIKVKNFQSSKSLKVKNIQVQKNVKFSKFKVGQKVNGHMWFGHSRHRWHGRWYGYGEGECWILIDGEWFWNELVCPL